MLKAGVIPWEKPWKTPRYPGGPFPRNFYTGKPYRGINILLLWSSEYSSPFWLTFKQAQALKGTVRKGEHGTQIIFYKQLPEHAKQNENTTGEDERVRFVLCHYTVFNVEQCDGRTLPQIEPPTTAPEIDVRHRQQQSSRHPVRSSLAISPSTSVAWTAFSTTDECIRSCITGKRTGPIGTILSMISPMPGVRSRSELHHVL